MIDDIYLSDEYYQLDDEDRAMEEARQEAYDDYLANNYKEIQERKDENRH